MVLVSCKTQYYIYIYIYIKTGNYIPKLKKVAHIPNTTNKKNLMKQKRFWPSLKRPKRETFEARLSRKTVVEQLENVDKLVREDLLQEKERGQQDRIPLTYNGFSPNLAAAVHKNWNILQTNKNLQELYQEHSIITLRAIEI